jgi:hypothetical protein
MTVGQEAFPCVSFRDETFIFFSKLVPECVKLSIMRADFVVRELVEHSVDDLFQGKELVFVSGIS